MKLKKPADVKKPRILIAEDIKNNMIITTTMLTTLYPGAVLSEAYNGEEAVSLYKRMKPDLILMDISMPKKTGIEAIEEIREHESDFVKKTPILALTAETEIEGVMRYIELGVNEIIAKPTTLETLKDKLSKFIPKI